MLRSAVGGDTLEARSKGSTERRTGRGSTGMKRLHSALEQVVSGAEAGGRGAADGRRTIQKAEALADAARENVPLHRSSRALSTEGITGGRRETSQVGTAGVAAANAVGLARCSAVAEGSQVACVEEGQARTHKGGDLGRGVARCQVV